MCLSYVLLIKSSNVAAFSSIRPPLTSSYHEESKSGRISNRRSPISLFSSSIPTPQEQTFDEFLPSNHPLHDLLIATSEACIPKPLEKTEGSSKPTEFRYEWGTWCSADKTDVVMELLGEIRLVTGAYEELMSDKLDNVVVAKEAGGKIGDDDEEVDKSGVKFLRRIRISSNKFYDIILYILPKGARYQHKWPEGSWTMLQPLTGLIEIAQLRGPDRDGFYTKMRPRDLRGGGDGSGFLGSGDAESQGGHSSSGEDCVKYLGGPLRSYTGKAMKSTLLEVVVRPPIDVNIDTHWNVEQFDWNGIENVLTRVVASEKEDDEDESLDVHHKEGTSDTNKSPSLESSSATSPSEGPLNKKMGMEFENVGGLDAQLDDIAVSKRMPPSTVLYVENVRYLM